MPDSIHCPHGCASPCSSCEGSALARELRALRILRDAVQASASHTHAIKVSHVEIARESWFAIARALASANLVTS